MGERVIEKKAGIFKLTLKLVQVVEEFRCFAKQFARLSWTNLPYWFQGQTDWSAGSKNIYPPRSEVFFGNPYDFDSQYKRDMSCKGPILSFIEIVSYLVLQSPCWTTSKFAKKGEVVGKQN